ncbi:MAG: alpha/beta hydrolase [Bacteroidota bacterium]
MKKVFRPYHFDLLPEELKSSVKSTPPVNFNHVWRARLGIAMMHFFMPKVDTKGVVVKELKIKRPSGDDGKLKIRVYEPAIPTSEKRLGMIFMHWGGFVVGNLKTEHYRCVRLCRSENMVIVSVEYRLAPENPFPLGLNDCETALKWFHQNAETYRVSKEHIGVGGTSAGGGLAASLALRGLRKGEHLINYQYLGFPVLDFRCSTESAKRHTGTPNWTSAANRLMWKYYLQNQTPNEIASPAIANELTGLPSTYIWTAEFDPLHDEAVAYSQRLIRDKVPTTFHDYRGGIHGFDSIPNAKGIIQKAHEDQQQFFAAFRKSK